MDLALSHNMLTPDPNKPLYFSIEGTETHKTDIWSGSQLDTCFWASSGFIHISWLAVWKTLAASWPQVAYVSTNRANPNVDSANQTLGEQRATQGAAPALEVPLMRRRTATCTWQDLDNVGQRREADHFSRRDLQESPKCPIKCPAHDLIHTQCWTSVFATRSNFYPFPPCPQLPENELYKLQ